jgi:hypothetical protein
MAKFLCQSVDPDSPFKVGEVYDIPCHQASETPFQPVMRAKMKVDSVLVHEGGETLKMSAVCKPGGYPADGLDEDNSFAKFSPSASLELWIANPALRNKFQPGEKFYLDFSAEVKPAETKAEG